MVSAPQPTYPKGPLANPGVPRAGAGRPGAGRRRGAARPAVAAGPADQAVHHQEPAAGLRALAVTIAIAVAAVHVSEWWFSPGVMILPILAGGLLLWPRALRIFFAFAAAALIYDVVEGKAGPGSSPPSC
jgi:hypothetical protein